MTAACFCCACCSASEAKKRLKCHRVGLVTSHGEPVSRRSRAADLTSYTSEGVVSEEEGVAEEVVVAEEEGVKAPLDGSASARR